jgi:hypothetical protein
MVRMRPIRSARVAAKSDDTPATRLQLEIMGHPQGKRDRQRQAESLTIIYIVAVPSGNFSPILSL